MKATPAPAPASSFVRAKPASPTVNLDGAATPLTGARARPHQALDPTKLFSAAARQREVGELQRTLGAGFGLTFVEVDLTDSKSVSSVAERFARAHVNGSATAGVTFARGLANNQLLVGQNMSPAAALAATGVDPDTGTKQRFAIVAFNAKNNHVMKGAFGDVSKVFGANELKQTEHMTLLHEAAHAVVHQAEQAGMETWSAALNSLGATDGQAGDSLRAWAASVEGAVSHPEVRQLLLGEAGRLDALQARARAGETGLQYDADVVQRAFQDLKSRPDYRNFQENMADGYMALKLKQEGCDVTRVVGAARARQDAEHNTSVGQAAIGTVRGVDLLGLNSTQLMVRTAQLVQTALGLTR